MYNNKIIYNRCRVKIPLKGLTEPSHQSVLKFIRLDSVATLARSCSYCCEIRLN